MFKKLFRQMIITQIISLMTVTLCMLIDSIMIGRFLGVDSMSAYGLASPLLLIFANAEKLGFFWWILLLSYCAILAGLIFMIYRYREITQMRGNFSRKEFEKMFKKELWLVSIMDNLSRFLLH